MKAIFRLVIVLVLLRCSTGTCTGSDADRVHYCKTFQKDYSEGIKTLIFEEREVGVINSSVLSSPNLRSVVTLTLRGSHIHTIESGAFQHFLGLINLELQNNKLTTISPSWFGNAAILEHLNMAGNRIGQLLPDMLDGFSGLKVLNLSSNEIRQIGSESFTVLTALSSLDLSNNKMAYLHRSTLASLNATFKLHRNPWDCSCAHKDFMLFLQEIVNASRLNESTSVACHSPPDLSGAIVWNVSELNCSVFVLPPLPGTSIHHIVFPALFVVLAVLLFILVLFLVWKKKQKKQVRPDRRATGLTKAAARGDSEMTAKFFGQIDFRSMEAHTSGTMGRAKSASAILVHESIQPVKSKDNVALEISKNVAKSKVKGAKDPCGPDDYSEVNKELWYYDSLPDGRVIQPSTAKATLTEPSAAAIRCSVHAQPTSDHDKTHIPAIALRPVVAENRSPLPNQEEPLVYLCIRTAPKEPTSPVKSEITHQVAKPQHLKRTFSWPKERVHCKEDTSAAYRNFLETLNISPGPGSSRFSNHNHQKDQKPDDANLKITSLDCATEKILAKDASRGTNKGSTTGDGVSKGDKWDPKCWGGQSHNPSSPRNTYQRSRCGKRPPRSKAVTPESGANREDLHSHESEARSDLRRTPDDDTLLENNEYHFIDLLHEVVENHGRWTRERWRQVHQRNSNRPSPQSQ